MVGIGSSAILFGRLLFVDLLEILGERDLQTLLIMFIKAVILEGVEGDCRLQHILEINKTQQVLPTTHCGLLDQSNALEAWKWPEYV